MITLHHLNNSRSQRVLWMLEELQTEYDIKRYQRNAQTLFAPPELKAVHPLGKSPVITDGDKTIAESALIIDYLIDRYGAGNFRPSSGTENRLRYDYWMHYSEGSLMPQLLMYLVFTKMSQGPMPFFARPVVKMIGDKVKRILIEPQLETHLDFLEAELSKSLWFAGPDFSGADVQMSFPVEAAAARGGLGTRRPKLQAYLERIHARPAYQRALKRGGPYTIMG